MTLQNLVGEYKIIGSNQDQNKVNYKGLLSLKLDQYNRVVAKWTIHKNQIQTGIGFLKNNILAINFQYLGKDLNTYKGTVIYKCITNDILEGFWFEEFGDPNFLGSEQCFRIKEEEIN